ncbi:MAG: extracellular solute-binding protein, partial [Dehalococcoidia bacterium]|nr:extracellular solute-binding protein [Dehalococcoidia bacterium]
MNLRLLFPRTAAVLAGTLLVLGAAAACGDDDQPSANATASSAAGTAQPSKVTLTVYSGQHEGLTQSLADAFQKETGIKIELRSGKDADLANQIIEEGSRTRADVFMTEEPGPIAQVDKAGLLSPVPASSLARVDKKYVPSTGNWIPYAARARAIYYNPSLIAENQLPTSIMDLVKPEWKGKFAYAPSGAFTGTVTYLINTIGKDATLAWLKGIKENGVNEGSNGKVRDTVEAGQHAFGLSNHYYWWILANTRGGPDELTSRIYYFDHPDAGGLLLPSGAAVLKAS